MVVFGASIMNKSGKVLIFKQTWDVTSMRVEELLPAFPELVGTGTGTGTDNPYVDGENVRYLYEPFEAFNLALVTDKQHCDMDLSYDLQTMKKISNAIFKLVPSLDEESVCREASKLTYIMAVYLDNRADKYKNPLKRKAVMQFPFTIFDK